MLLLLIAADGSAQAPPNAGVQRPSLAGRVVRAFDFEERETNPLPVPQHWFRAQSTPEEAGEGTGSARPGFPPWNAAELDYTVAHTGVGSVRLPALGGSACLRLEPGVVPVLPGADYSITVAIRTDGGHHARARLTARLLDAKGAPIPDSSRSTAPIDTLGGWEVVSLSVRGDASDAAFLQLDLEMLQPREWERATLPDFKVWPEDFRAGAWFDDIRISQLPRVELRVDGSSSVVRSEQPPTLRASLRDLTGQRLVARMSVRDLDGTLVDAAVVGADRGPGGLEWQPQLDQFGWFRARLELFADGELVGVSDAPFGWLPPDAADRAPARRFVLIADRMTPRLMPALPPLVADVGAGAVVIPAWHSGFEAASIASQMVPIERAIDAMLDARVQVGLSLPVVPDELATRASVDPRDPLRLFAGDPALIEPYLARLVDRYGQVVLRWLIGSPAIGTVAQDAVLTEQLTRADSALGRLVPGPIVAVPWDGASTLPTEVTALPPDAMVMTEPQGVGPGGIVDWLGAVLQSLGTGPRRSNDPIEITLVARVPDASSFGGSAAIAQFARQVVQAWTMAGPAEQAGVTLRMGLVDPWDAAGGADPLLQATPELVAFAGLASQLTARRVVLRLPTAPGVHAYLLEPAPNAPRGREAAIVAWCDGPAGEESLELYLGPDAISAADPFMNRSVPTIRAGSSRSQVHLHVVPLSPMPVFIEGVDAGIVALGASFRVEPPFIPATNEAHERTLVIRNPFRTTIDLRYFISKPGTDESGRPDRSWNVSPRSGSILVPPGEEGRIPITVVPSSVEEAGPKQFVLDAQVSADRAYGWIQLVSSAELGLPGLRVDIGVTATGDDQRADLVLDAHIANTGTDPMTLDVAAFAPGFPRQRSSVSELAPGTSVVRRFVFPASRQILEGERLIVSVVDTGTGGRLNTGATLAPGR